MLLLLHFLLTFLFHFLGEDFNKKSIYVKKNEFSLSLATKSHKIALEVTEKTFKLFFYLSFFTDTVKFRITRRFKPLSKGLNWRVTLNWWLKALTIYRSFYVHTKKRMRRSRIVMTSFLFLFYCCIIGLRINIWHFSFIFVFANANHFKFASQFCLCQM